MLLIAGLGNPGKKYASNRHNVGFMAADELVRKESLGDFREKFSGLFLRANASFGEVGVLEPHTFMNLSGDSVQPCAAFLKVPLQDLVVLHDELDLPFGDVRIKLGGGHAGHNGLRSMIERLGAPDFVRIRIGIGRPPPGFRGDVADYVLSNFDPSEKAELPSILDKAVLAAISIGKNGVQAAMAAVNAKAPVRNTPKKAEKADEKP